MKRSMFVMLLIVALVFGGIFFFKYMQAHERKKYVAAHRIIVSTVSAIPASKQQWEPHLEATGSLRTVKGVNVTTELSGMIRDIYFESGAYVKKGTKLVCLDIDPDIAKLHELQANAEVAKITYFRDKKQYQIGAVSKETLDREEGNYKATAALVEEQRGIIAKKIIRAPFEGKLGISTVNPGEFINPGDNIVTLETLDPIYADFYLPQQDFPRVSIGQIASLSIDAYPGKTYTGKVTTINPIVDKSIRNVEVEATLPNPQHELLPGMFVSVNVRTGDPIALITLPKMAITFNPYGSLVYVLTSTKQTYQEKPVWQATQKLIQTGESRGDQVAVLKGVEEGEFVVTSGQLKLKNGSYVIINNRMIKGK